MATGCPLPSSKPRTCSSERSGRNLAIGCNDFKKVYRVGSQKKRALLIAPTNQIRSTLYFNVIAREGDGMQPDTVRRVGIRLMKEDTPARTQEASWVCKWVEGRCAAYAQDVRSLIH
jgi:hypothetical protein